MPPGLVCPGRSEVIALPPAGIMPQDGHDKQDGERVAGTRWMATHATPVAPDGLTWLGDDLYSPHPLGPLALHKGLHVLLVCKPAAQATLSKRVAFWQAHEAIQELETRRWGGRFTPVPRSRSLHEVLLQGGQRAVGVQGLAMTSVHAKTGEPLSHHRLITTPRLRTDNVAEVAQAGRGRGQSENANPNVLTTQGSPIAPNVGHGQQSLAAFLLSLTLLALLCHTVLEWGDDT